MAGLIRVSGCVGRFRMDVHRVVISGVRIVSSSLNKWRVPLREIDTESG